MTRRQDAIDSVGCPKCLVRKGQPCEYVYAPKDPGVGRSVRQDYWDAKRTERVGRPTLVPHNERMSRLDDFLRAQWNAEVTRTDRAERAARRDRKRAAQAVVDYEFEEILTLRKWLRENGSIFDV